jgi:ABC-type lipoprotein release transport system permease subunit
MSEAMTTVTLASFGLIALGIVLLAALKGWQGWLEVRRLELSGHGQREPRGPAADLIEMADLKERIRKLESIAACIDL